MLAAQQTPVEFAARLFFVGLGVHAVLYARRTEVSKPQWAKTELCENNIWIGRLIGPVFVVVGILLAANRLPVHRHNPPPTRARTARPPS